MREPPPGVNGRTLGRYAILYVMVAVIWLVVAAAAFANWLDGLGGYHLWVAAGAAIISLLSARGAWQLNGWRRERD